LIPNDVTIINLENQDGEIVRQVYLPRKPFDTSNFITQSSFIFGERVLFGIFLIFVLCVIKDFLYLSTGEVLWVITTMGSAAIIGLKEPFTDLLFIFITLWKQTYQIGYVIYKESTREYYYIHDFALFDWSVYEITNQWESYENKDFAQDFVTIKVPNSFSFGVSKMLQGYYGCKDLDIMTSSTPFKKQAESDKI
jgi:hypothetical protein